MNVSGHNIEIITRFEHAFRAANQATIDELCDPGLVQPQSIPARLSDQPLGGVLRIPNLVELPRIEINPPPIRALRLCHTLPGIGKKFTLGISVSSIGWNSLILSSPSLSTSTDL